MKDIEKENDELKKELNTIHLKLDTLQHSINMINMLMTSNSFQMQPVAHPQPIITNHQPQEPQTLVKKINDDDIDDDAFDI